VILLAPADDELAFLDGHVELIAGEARDRQRDPQPLGAVGIAGDPLDVVGRIAVGRLGDAVERALDLVKSEQEGAGQRRNSGHGLKALVSDFDWGPCGTPSTVRRCCAGRSSTIWGRAVKPSRIPGNGPLTMAGGQRNRAPIERRARAQYCCRLRKGGKGRRACALQSWGRAESAAISAPGWPRAAPTCISSRAERIWPPCASAALRSRAGRRRSICPRSPSRTIPARSVRWT